VNKAYIVAKICYDPHNKFNPWLVIRQGTIPAQGGFDIGTENVRFSTAEQACLYLLGLVPKDKEVIKELAESKESHEIS
jgi:hypothetical protein